jgi:hypothetical protein
MRQAPTVDVTTEERRDRSRIAVLGFTMLLCASCCNPPENIASQNVTLRPQETSMWCWAASGQMVMDFLGGSVSQGDEANKRFGRTDCLNSPVPTACIQGGWPEFGKYGFSFKTTSDAPLSWDSLKSQIYCAKKPFAFAWHWTGGGGHMMVATGYATLNGTHYVAVNNPWAPNVGAQYLTTYDEYVSGADHTHWDDYYDVTKN